MTETLSPYSHQRNEHYMVRVNREMKCVCQLCSCGQHKCPRPIAKGDYQTSYNNHYHNFTVQPMPQLERPGYTERHYNPESLRTNYQQTYVPLQMESPTISKSRLEKREVLRSQPFIGVTSYKEEYKPFRIQNGEEQVDNSKVRDSLEHASIKFQGQSSYKAAYHSLPMPKLERYKHPEYKNSRPFQGSSSYKDNYVGFKVQPILQKVPMNMGRQNQVKFQGSSTYNNHYGSFKVAIEPEQKMVCKLDKLNIPSANFLNQSKHIYYDQGNRQFI